MNTEESNDKDSPSRPSLERLWMQPPSARAAEQQAVWVGTRQLRKEIEEIMRCLSLCKAKYALIKEVNSEELWGRMKSRSEMSAHTPALPTGEPRSGQYVHDAGCCPCRQYGSCDSCIVPS